MGAAARAQSAQGFGGAEFLAFLESFFCGFLFGLLHVEPPVGGLGLTGPVERCWLMVRQSEMKIQRDGAAIARRRLRLLSYSTARLHGLRYRCCWRYLR